MRCLVALSIFAAAALTACSPCTLVFVPDRLEITFSRPLSDGYSATVTSGDGSYSCDTRADGTQLDAGAAASDTIVCTPDQIRITATLALGDAAHVSVVTEGRTISAKLAPQTKVSHPNGGAHCGSVKAQTATLNVD